MSKHTSTSDIISTENSGKRSGFRTKYQLAKNSLMRCPRIRIANSFSKAWHEVYEVGDTSNVFRYPGGVTKVSYVDESTKNLGSSMAVLQEQGTPQRCRNRAHVIMLKGCGKNLLSPSTISQKDKRNLAQHTQGKKKATLIMIPSIQFTKLIIFHLQRLHNFHPITIPPLHLPIEEPVLGNLKFSAKGTKREMSEPESLAPKAAKPTKPKSTKQAKPTDPKAATKKPKPAPAKPKEKKRKPVSELLEAPPLAKRAKAGKVVKKRTVKISKQVIPEERASSTGTLSSLQQLGKDFSFGDQFFNDKPSDAEMRRRQANTEAESMVSLLNFHSRHHLSHSSYDVTGQDADSFDKAIRVRKLRRKESKIHQRLRLGRTFTTPNPHSSSTTVRRISGFCTTEAYRFLLAQAPPTTNLPPHPLIREVRQQAPRPQVPQRQAASAEYSAWTMTDTRIKPSITTIPDDLYMDDENHCRMNKHNSSYRPASPEPAWTIPSSDLPVPTNNWASALKTTYVPPPENSLLPCSESVISTTLWIVPMEECHNSTDKSNLPILTVKIVIPALSISKMKAAFYPDVGLEQLKTSLGIEQLPQIAVKTPPNHEGWPSGFEFKHDYTVQSLSKGSLHSETDDVVWGCRSEGHYTTWRQYFTTRMIKRFTVADDIKECSRITIKDKSKELCSKITTCRTMTVLEESKTTSQSQRSTHRTLRFKL
ncbi:hypothetical protein Tco_0138122 [Tanacetum coccineum]